MSANNQIAVVICSYNRSASLLQTLASIYGCGYDGPEQIDIVVVANNCSDDTLPRLTSFLENHPQDRLKLTWLVEPKAGKSYALNMAIEKTSHEVLCFIDDDQIVENGFLQHLLEGIKQYPEDGIFCGRIWPAWDGTEPAWVHAKEPYSIPVRPFPEFDLGLTPLKIDPAERYPSGGNISVRREVFKLSGHFSIQLGPTGHNLAGGEDHDFLRRATDNGFTIRYLPQVRQLHAIDAERMSAHYTLKKSYFRSRSSFVIHALGSKPRLYMFRKILNHCTSAIFTFNQDRRFFYLVRLAASAGELAGAFTFYRHPTLNRHRLSLPLDRGILLIAALALLTAICGLIAWFVSGNSHWAGVLPALAVAGIGTMALLAKSLFDFSQTGPRMREEIRTYYRHYIVFALARLSLWAFGLMLYMGGGGVLIYYSLNINLGWTWSSKLAILAAILGLLGASALQFIRKLRFNPGLLVASMHYRMSRFYSLWHWATPARIQLIQSMLGISAMLLVIAASWQLSQQNKVAELMAFWSTVLFYVGTITWAAWLPEAQHRGRSLERPSDAPPNILMIGSDTLRADRLGALGYHRAVTPHIDALAAKGTLFANCYVPCARTAPSLISMLTGTWPHTHGIRDNFVSDAETRLKVDALPQLLKPLGYRTAAMSDWCGGDMGKFSFGFDYTDLPEDQWNLKYLIRQGPKDLRLFVSLFTHNRLGRLLLPEIYYLGGVPLTQSMGKYARRLVSRLAHSVQPFFFNLFYSTTHPPFTSEWPWYTRFSDPTYNGESKFAMARLTDPFEVIRRQGAPKEEFDLDQIIDLYDGCAAEFDDEVGKMLRHLDDCGLADSTIVVVYSDHGMEFFEHNTWGQGNSAVGDFSARIPLIIHDPRTPSNGIQQQIVRSVDIAPTLLELAGLAIQEAMEGVSLGSIIRGKNNDLELPAFNETGIWITDLPGMHEDHLRYPNLLELLEVPDKASGTLVIKPQYRDIVLEAKDRMIRIGRWKLVYQPAVVGARYQLFDLKTDPGCQHNRIADNPELAETMKLQLLTWVGKCAKTK